MSGYKIIPIAGLHDPATGALVGVLGGDGQEYLFPAVTGPSTGYTDTSASAGDTTNKGVRGKAAFAATKSTCVVTNPACKPSSLVLATLQGADSTLTQILRVVPANGSFTVTGNAAATGSVPFGYQVFN